MAFSTAALLAALALGVSALPAVPRSGAVLDLRAVSELSSSQLSAFAPYTEFARAAYCASSAVIDWSCGEACEAIPGFQPTLTGGDGNDVQLYFVGYWPAENAVVVAHQGTDPTQLLSDLTDIDIITESLDSTLFPGVPSDVWVHSGFANEQATTAPTIFAEVNSLLSANSASTVISIGHSLGGAIAELDALYFTLNLPSSIKIVSYTYGTPRVGNPAYATFFDSVVPNFTRMNNEIDPIPIVPGRFLGFQHPAGEVHIVSSSEVVACSLPDDDTDAQCTDLSVPNVFESDLLDHLGPYEGIYIGTIYCT